MFGRCFFTNLGNFLTVHGSKGNEIKGSMIMATYNSKRISKAAHISTKTSIHKVSNIFLFTQLSKCYPKVLLC